MAMPRGSRSKQPMSDQVDAAQLAVSFTMCAPASDNCPAALPVVHASLLRSLLLRLRQCTPQGRPTCCCIEAYLSHDRDLLQELLILTSIILHLLENLYSYFLPAVVAPIQVTKAACCYFAVYV
eukprot:GHUV01022744.1.p1 GENE.GHUV01022744.1~~GHUV01022744.1.p1  ORF type:complete len:124 (-),score=12.96 GHUV01022744.1:667-1038(-)